MQAGKRYSIWQTVNWTRKQIIILTIWVSIPVVTHALTDWEWMHIPWQPISLVGIAVAFYLGFKNNSSYERLWEGRKIWGGIVNSSRSFTVMARDFMRDLEHDPSQDAAELKKDTQRLVHRHVAWLRALALELRKPQPWEHNEDRHNEMRDQLGTTFTEEKMDQMKPYLSQEDFDYVMSQGNRSSHLLSLQSSDLRKLRESGKIEHFRHLAIQELITEFYTLQGKCERINKFPFPRQYSSVNHIFVSVFILILPFGMLDVFSAGDGKYFYWISIPFTVLCSWVFLVMDLIGDYSENPFEGLFNDVPITNMSVGIERDIRAMIGETDLPDPIGPQGDLQLLV